MKLIKSKNLLAQPTRKCESVEEGERIAELLIESLDTYGGVGLAANQIGINKSVCVIRGRKDEDPKVLINPRCISSSTDKVIYIEGCLSLPGKRYKTLRHKTVKVACDNWANEIEFGPDGELSEENFWNDEGMLECVCIQHEIGHLNGELICDPAIRFTQPNLKSAKIGRNEKVMIKKGDETQFVKYKKAIPLIDAGWVVV